MIERGAVVANHSSWLDIFALNATQKIYFVAKSEVANWPGIGWLYMESVRQREVDTIMALNFMTATLVLICTLLADLAYGLVDPRISHD